MNVANIFAVGLASGLIGAAIAYFVLIRSADFQWWWVFILFGAQFLSVIVVAYVLQKSLKFNNMFCEAPVLAADNCDWNSLFAAPAAAPKFVASDCFLSTTQSIDANSADWQDLVQQLDQMSKLPVTAGFAASDAATFVSAAIKTAVPSAPAAQSPEPPMFDFASIASGLATPASTTVTTPVVASIPILTPAKTTVITAATAPVATFASTPAPTVIPAKIVASSPTPVAIPVSASVIAAPPPTVTSAFDFSAMASALATPAPAPISIPAKAATTAVAVPVTTVAPVPVLAKAVTTTAPPVPVVPAQTTSSIDFAGLFR